MERSSDSGTDRPAHCTTYNTRGTTNPTQPNPTHPHTLTHRRHSDNSSSSNSSRRDPQLNTAKMRWEQRAVVDVVCTTIVTLMQLPAPSNASTIDGGASVAGSYIEQSPSVLQAARAVIAAATDTIDTLLQSSLPATPRPSHSDCVVSRGRKGTDSSQADYARCCCCCCTSQQCCHRGCPATASRPTLHRRGCCLTMQTPTYRRCMSHS